VAGIVGRGVARREALCALLASPDPPELAGRRVYSYRIGRDPLRCADALKRDLATAYAAWRRNVHADESHVVSVRRRFGIVRRIA